MARNGEEVHECFAAPYRYMAPDEFEDDRAREDTIWSIVGAISERVTANGFINLYRSKGRRSSGETASGVRYLRNAELCR